MNTTTNTRTLSLALPRAAFRELSRTGSTSHVLTKPAHKAARALEAGVRVLACDADERRRPRREWVLGCIVARRDEPRPESLPVGSVPAGHRGPAAFVSIISDAHARSLEPSGALASQFPAYVPPPASLAVSGT